MKQLAPSTPPRFYRHKKLRQLKSCQWKLCAKSFHKKKNQLRQLKFQLRRSQTSQLFWIATTRKLSQRTQTKKKFGARTLSKLLEGKLGPGDLQMSIRADTETPEA